MTKKILIVDDEENVRYSFRKFYQSSGYEVIEAANGLEAISVVDRQKPDLVLMDIEMPGLSGLEAIQRIKQLQPDIPVVIITAFGTSERVISAMKHGAFDYLEKPFDVERLKTMVAEALEVKQLKDDQGFVEIRPSKEITDDQIIGKSSAIKEVFKMIGRVAASDVSVLINGESGTGKELIARAIYRYSDRVNKPFYAVNCAALPDTLLESELFGYEKGSFTNAVQSRQGKFEAAHQGTMFLDEVADMSLTLQAKLLRVIQEGTFERIGSNKTIKVDVRFVSATNKNLENAIVAGTFREDLYYRLKVISISLPPLRIRREDIPLLTEYFLARQCRQLNKPMISLPKETMDALLNYDWPGNVRELENLLKRALLLSKGSIITPSAVTSEMGAVASSVPNVSLGRHIRTIPYDFDQYEGKLYEHVINQAESELISACLRQTNGNQVKAAKLLGISRAMLHERIEKYNILPEHPTG
jgi:DNA-binding NtrC family response regulator